MKELVKPKRELTAIESNYEALAECTTVNIDCICDGKYGFSEEDAEDIIF